VSVVGWSGRSRVFGGRLFSASRAGHKKSKQFTHRKVSVFRGTDILLRMRSHLWMMRAILFSLVSGVAGILTVRIRDILSDMKRGN
jgi:hypothetical protein